MRNLLLCVCLFILASCITVVNFGSYWERGTIDPALIGRWEEVVTRGENRASVEVSVNDGAYVINSLDDYESGRKAYEAAVAKTLKAGPYNFLMILGDGTKGWLVRYKIDGDIFQEYSLNSARMQAYLKKNYPVKNKKPNIAEADLWGMKFIGIKNLDTKTYEILSAIPDTPEFWLLRQDGRYRRSLRLN